MIKYDVCQLSAQLFHNSGVGRDKIAPARTLG